MHLRRHRILATLLVLALVLLSGDSGSAKSKVVMSWRNPQAPAAKFHRVLALGLSQKTTVRADFEDGLAKQLDAAGFETVPGNTILLRPEGTVLDLNYLRGQ